MTLGELRALFGIPLPRPGWGLGANCLSPGRADTGPDQWLGAWGVFSFLPPKRKEEGGGDSFKNEKEAQEPYKPR